MKNKASRGKVILKATFYFYLFILISFGGTIEASVSSNLATASTIYHGQAIASSCPNPTEPTAQSLLVLMLDRSGSLTEGPFPTDPSGYSTSVTKALADLWPGKMAVVVFNNDSTHTFGPAPLLNPVEHLKLKQEIQDYPIGGNTPLEAAMNETLQLMQGAAPGSRAILVTDGSPNTKGDEDGSKQSQAIHDNLIPAFCSQGIPINVFGLTINDSNANQLLTDIALQTGTSYINVQNPKQLSTIIINLYAQWRNYTFVQIGQDQDGTFPISIDSFVQNAYIITFRSDKNDPITLLGPDGQVAKGIEKSTPDDQHYEIDSLALNSSFPTIQGIYRVNVGNDPDAQVYALIQSSLHVQITSPSSRTAFYTGHSITIQAGLFDDKNQLTPQEKQAQFRAYFTLTVNGQIVQRNEEDLKQQGNFFNGQTPSYSQTGKMQITVRASYEGAKRETSIVLQVQQTPPPPSLAFILPICLLASLIILLLLLARAGKNKIGKVPDRKLEYE